MRVFVILLIMLCACQPAYVPEPQPINVPEVLMQKPNVSQVLAQEMPVVYGPRDVPQVEIMVIPQTNEGDERGCSAAAYYAAKVKDISLVQKCSSEKVLVDGAVAEVVTIWYGEGADCPAGCIYRQYTGIVRGKNVTDFFGSPVVFYDLLRFGGSCGNVDLSMSHPGFARTIVSKEGELVWRLVFKNFKPGDYPLHRSWKEYEGTTCILDGFMDAHLRARHLFDFSGLRVTYATIDSCENMNVTDSSCLWDEPADVCAKNNCLANIAVARNDSSICERIVPERTDRPSLAADGCYLNVAWFETNPETCEKVVDEGLRNACYGRVAGTLRNESICWKIKEGYDRQVCKQLALG